MALPSTKNHANEKSPSSPENEWGSKFIARQPIFDRQQQVYGYELLPRPDGSDLPGGPDSNKSPGREIGNHSFHHSIGKLVGNRKAFLSFSRELLLSDPAPFFRKDATVINIPKAVELDAEMRTACRRLKTSGYCLALDDVDSMERPIAFLDLLDFIGWTSPEPPINSKRNWSRTSRRAASHCWRHMLKPRKRFGRPKPQDLSISRVLFSENLSSFPTARSLPSN